MFRLTHRLLDLFARYAAFSAHRPVLPLLVILGLAAAGVHFSMTRLKLDPRFDALLPQGNPSVVARREASRRLGSSDLYLIAVDSPNVRANYRFVRKAAEHIAKWPETDWVLHKRDAAVFRKNALFYAQTKDLKEIAITLKRVVDRALKKGRSEAGGFVEIDDDYEEEQKKQDQRDRNRLKELARKYRASNKGERKAPLFKKNPDLKDALVNKKGNVAVVIAKLKKGTNDVEFARTVYKRGQDLIKLLGPKKNYHPKMKARVGGAYRSFKEYDQALKDIRNASIASLAMVLGLLIVFFRRIRAVVVVLVPLLIGIAWAGGYAALVFGTMNIITSFIVAILIGLGIDFAIHLYAAYRNARMAGEDLQDGLRSAVLEAGPGMFTAALTTAAALLTLVAGHFRAFQEFGWIAAGGVMFCLLAALLALPPVVAVLERLRAERFPAPPAEDAAGTPARTRRNHRLAWATGGVALCITALLVWRAPSIQFEYDFSKLRGKGAAKTGIAYGSVLKGGTAGMALLGDNEQQIRRAHQILEERSKKEQRCCDLYLAGKKPTGTWCDKMGLNNPRSRRMVYERKGRRYCKPRIINLVTIQTFIPSEQPEKLRYIEQIRETLKPDKKKGDPIEEAPKELRSDLIELKRYARVTRPFGVADLPPWVRRTLTERRPNKDGSPKIGAIGFVYTSLSFRDVRDMMDLARDYSRVKVGDKYVRLAASSFVVAGVVQTVQKDGRRLFLYAAIAVLLLLLIDLLSITGALICFVTLGLGFAWSMGLMQWYDLKLGVYNMLVVPTALGVGIDGSVHLYHRFRRLGAAYPGAPLGHTGMAVVASAITTAAGFAGLFFIKHGGLQTIAQFAVLSICLTLLAILTILPGLLMLRAARLKPAASPPAETTES